MEHNYQQEIDRIFLENELRNLQRQVELDMRLQVFSMLLIWVVLVVCAFYVAGIF